MPSPKQWSAYRRYLSAETDFLSEDENLYIFKILKIIYYLIHPIVSDSDSGDSNVLYQPFLKMSECFT
jgi:hypothetical protein